MSLKRKNGTSGALESCYKKNAFCGMGCFYSAKIEIAQIARETFK